MSKLSLWKTILLWCVFCAVEAISSPAQTLKTLVSFNGTDGSGPEAPLVQGIDGNFYGTTQFGGANDAGAVFKITPGGTLSTLHSFDHTDGAYPSAGLVQATNGNFYGTTFTSTLYGTVFEITSGGRLTTLYSFGEGSPPYAGLVQATNGNFYGTTLGTVFEITPGAR
jgi:uncharacterized repeat protein (TIGR03803 family)